ncbi:DUF364 domain-containing protein [Hydrogenibacillus sp. N12]|uniref:DUF364 domain-containing protein n=1 Tax=Hydrogenibacillus sp. N12 TaxID=2866627 RepID=UPI001C7CC208|nr:DUF364 domain-containing protein [Hydrogenibacillus sp. N12]QZA32259.1 DUF364 domain-containing protein [Hydrogenibacillus sp. N12]
MSREEIEALYHALIDPMPRDLPAERVLVSAFWTLVESPLGVGVAYTPTEGRSPDVTVTGAGGLRGRSLRELAMRVDSWQLLDVAVGMAAINAYWNTPAQAAALRSAGALRDVEENSFIRLAPALKDKMVAVVGHFPGLERLGIGRLTVLERRPRPGDLPDSAQEAVLPEQDVVFVTAATLVNKTLPRILALSRKARVILVGPTAPLSPALFHFGVDLVAGALVTDGARLWQTIEEGGRLHGAADAYRLVELEPPVEEPGPWATGSEEGAGPDVVD